MIRNLLRRLADFERDDSLAIKIRLKTIALFKELTSPLPKPLRILDVGGTEVFWERFGFAGDSRYNITLLNLHRIETHHSNLRAVVGDARNMPEFRDGEFDIVFSHSVIEHVGDYDAQKQMVRELLRVGKRYFLQTPNFYFPFEPHFLFPCFQFLPLWLKTILLRHFSLGWDRIPDKVRARKIASSIRLLKSSELRELFPGATIQGERFMGISVSLVVYGGW